MLTVPSVLLRHTTASDAHHDWLLGDPARGWSGARAGGGAARLWTARVAPASARWAALGGFELLPIFPHRPVYLRYEGPLGGDRGEVRRVDAGYALVLTWRAERAVLAVRMAAFRGWLVLTPTRSGAATGSDELWRATVLGGRR